MADKLSGLTKKLSLGKSDKKEEHHGKSDKKEEHHDKHEKHEKHEKEKGGLLGKLGFDKKHDDQQKHGEQQHNKTHDECVIDEVMPDETKRALERLGMDNREKVKLTFPKLKLSDKNYTSSLSVMAGDPILKLDNVALFRVNGNKEDEVHSATPLSWILQKTSQENVIVMTITGGETVHFKSFFNLDEKPSFRPYRFHYLLADDNYNIYMLRISTETSEENLNKLDVLLTYYARYFRLNGLKPSKEDLEGAAKQINKTANVIEGVGETVAGGIIHTSLFISDTAKKASDFYIAHTHECEHSEMTEEQKKKLEDKTHSLTNVASTVTEDAAKGITAVKKGVGYVVGGAALAVTKAAIDPIKNTSTYQNMEEKKKKKQEEAEAKGEKDKAGVGGAAVEILKSTVTAFNTVKGSVSDGIVISATGVRDARVAAVQHSEGEYAAELSKRRMNMVADVAVSVMNLMKLLPESWIQVGLYAAAGAASYDIDKAEHLSPGGNWLQSWLMVRAEFGGVMGWTARWAVLRTHSFALYKDPDEPHDKPLQYWVLTKFRHAVPVSNEKGGGDSCFEIASTSGSMFFSTKLHHVSWIDEHGVEHETDPTDSESQLHRWVSSLETLIHFYLPLRLQNLQEEHPDSHKH